MVKWLDEKSEAVICNGGFAYYQNKLFWSVTTTPLLAKRLYWRPKQLVLVGNIGELLEKTRELLEKTRELLEKTRELLEKSIELLEKSIELVIQKTWTIVLST